MEVQLTTDLQAKLDQLVSTTGRTQQDFVLDAMAGYFEELAPVREMLDSRYDDIKSGKVKRIDGAEYFEDLRRREEELIAKLSR